MRWSKFSPLIVASILNPPGAVICTTYTFSGIVVGPSRPISPSSQRQVAIGFAPGICAALRKPCGFIQSSTGKMSATSGSFRTGGPSAPSMCHA